MKKIRIIKAHPEAWYHNLIGVVLNCLPIRHLTPADAIESLWLVPPDKIPPLCLVLEANGINYWVNANDVEFFE